MFEEFRDMDRLSNLLEAESNGHHFDHGEARRLADSISRSFPDVAKTLNLMVERHSEKRN
jgi:hypothetical protein